jgi:pyruvate ferredoxin oxidoreductase beta subunit/2-oxoisovalerate ferredoxin oxidoreductase beta subunit
MNQGPHSAAGRPAAAVAMTDYEFCSQYDLYGHMACPGCGEKILLRHILNVLGPETVIVCPAGCAAVTDGVFPHSISPVPFLHVPFDATPAAAAGVRAGLDLSGRKHVTVLAWAGDGATFDIGMGALSAIAERNENILYVCYDNEAYMNTGIQRSSATPYGGWSTTTPKGQLKAEPKKNIGAIMAAHRIPYFASGSPAFLDDLTAKVAQAKRLSGLRFLHLLSPCPPGWKADPRDGITLARLAVESRLFPLYEIIEGTHYRLTHESSGAGFDEYLQLQGRFRYMSAGDRRILQADADRFYAQLTLRHNRNGETTVIGEEP